MIECTKTEVIALRSNAQIDKKRTALLHLVAFGKATIFPPEKSFKSFNLPKGQIKIDRRWRLSPVTS